MNGNHLITRTIGPKLNGGWTAQPDAVLKDVDLTSDAKVVILFLLSVSKDFHLNTRGIAKTVHLSESKVRRAVALLQITGYLKIEKVKLGKVFGYMWLISDVPGTYGASTDGTSIYEQSMDGTSMDGTSMGANTYKLSNDKEPKDKRIKSIRTKVKTSTPTPSPKEEGDEVNENLSLNGSSFIVYPSSGKNSSSAEPISHKEYLYQQFLKKYPRKPTRAAATKQAFFDIPDLEDIFAEIMAGLDAWCNSVQWNKNGGQYITNPFDFITLQKWEEIPRGINTEIDPGLAKFLNVPMEVYL